MKTREERVGRTAGRSSNGPPDITGPGDGPSPFLSRPSSPLGTKAKHADTAATDTIDQQGAHATGHREHQDSDHAHDKAAADSNVDGDIVRRRHRTKSMGDQGTSGSTYPPSRSTSSARPLTGGSPSFMMGSWTGYSSKAGIVGMGSHSLMQMINAIGLDAAREEEEDAIEESAPGNEDHLLVSQHRPNQNLQERHSADSSDEDSSDGEHHMRATVADQSQARRKAKQRWMSSSIDAIHHRMPGRRVWPKGSNLPSSHGKQIHSILKPHKSILQYDSLPMLSEEAAQPTATHAENHEQLVTSPTSTSSPTTQDTSTAAQSEDVHEEDADDRASTPSSPSPPESIIVDMSADQYDTLDDDESRRAILAQKLQEVFNLPSAETVLAEYPSWLFRSILLQGFMYLTERHLCFYAYIKGKEGQVVRSGTMYRRFSKSIMQSKYWFILKDDVLSWYSSSTNPYFPIDHIPLHYVTSIEPSPTHADRFKIITPHKIYRFATESAKSQQEWIKTLRKVAFRSQSGEDSVKLVLPLATIAKVDVAENLEFAKATMRVEATEMQLDGSVTPDDYYFSFAGDPHEVAEAVEESVMRAKQAISEEARSSSNTPQGPNSNEDQPADNASHSSRINYPRSSSPQRQDSGDMSDEDSNLVTGSHSTLLEGYTYPPETSGLPQPRVLSDAHRKPWGTWIRKQPRRVLGVPAQLPFASRLPFTYWGQPSKRDMSHAGDGAEFSTEDEADMIGEIALARKEKAFLKTTFGLGEREELIYQQRCYLSRGVPVYGTLYVTTSHVCFKSQSILTKTKMILPLREVIAVQKAKPLRFDLSGMVLVVRGHEELFFELSSSKKRDDLLIVIMHQLRTTEELEAATPPSPEQKKELADLEALHKLPTSPSSRSDTSQIMFGSATSSFVTFQPPQPLHITCLTVGSRGDVQPYIALCCGLMKEGHHCRIASHPEYRSWVESYGIEFRSVGGDPAELMRICVENGMFTVSFLREGVAKFRGWLDDLLVSSWEACQGTDLLIESPSTMAGVHIAEAMQIPFFRAFTMPWTRTRAYPHAFAVPDTKMGGGYNYMTYTIFDQVFWLAISGQVNRWRKSVLGLQPTTAEKLELHKMPFLYNFSPTLVPRPMDWMEHIHVTGYWYLDNADTSGKHWEPPADLLDFMNRARAAKKKLVYIGFGSIVVSDPAALTSMVLEAVEEAGVWAIISKGWSDRIASAHDSPEAKAEKQKQDQADLGALPENVFNIASIPHDWLFPRVDAVCHHGGAGTTGASLRAGKPTIIKPFFGDQAFWAERVETLRVGIALRRMTAPALAAALVTCTQDMIMIESARRLGQDIRQENGVATAIEAIYRDLDYARSLIKHDTRLAPKKPDAPATSPHTAGHDGTLSDGGSSGWDKLSERTSSGHAISDDEDGDLHNKSARGSFSLEGDVHVVPSHPLRRSTSNTIKRTLSRANSILPVALLSRRRHSHSKAVPLPASAPLAEPL